MSKNDNIRALFDLSREKKRDAELRPLYQSFFDSIRFLPQEVQDAIYLKVSDVILAEAEGSFTAGFAAALELMRVGGADD